MKTQHRTGYGDSNGHGLTLNVNGKQYSLAVRGDATLLDVLRLDLGLTGARRACETNFCGACTVLLDGKAVHSCSVLALAVRNKSVLTIEGLSRNGELHPLQESFVKHGAIQCGYCSPGMILAAKALLDENPAPSEHEVREAIAGNLCRCTGYKKIVYAVLAVARGGRD